jgi:hypothetical protein
VFDSCPDLDKSCGRVKIVPIRGPTKKEALAFLDKVGLLKADDNPVTLAKLTLVAELVGDRFTSLKYVAAAARWVTVTQQGGFLSSGPDKLPLCFFRDAWSRAFPPV